MVAWTFPPHHATGVHVPASIAAHAQDVGWDVSVVTSPPPPTPSAAGRELASIIPLQARVHHVSRLIATENCMRIYPMGWSIPAIEGGYLTAIAMVSTALRRLADDPPSAVFGTGPSFVNFVAARLLADAFRAKLILQYRDEWTVNTPSFVQIGSDDRAEEARCLARADLVTFVSEGKKTLYRNAFPEIDSGKLMTLPNGWEPFFHQLARPETNHLEDARGAFTLTYTGRWHTSLAPFLEAVEQTLKREPALQRRLRVVFVGQQTRDNVALLERFEQTMPGVLLVLPGATPTVAIEIQRESSALLLINDHLYDGVVPLKTFDYVNSSRPILVFGKTGGAARIVNELSAGLAVDVRDVPGFAAALSMMMNTEASEWDTQERRAWSAKQNRATLTAQLLHAIEALEERAPAVEPQLAPV
jgi:glycosyltransferase involved in cell wall biosynthesis